VKGQSGNTLIASVKRVGGRFALDSKSAPFSGSAGIGRDEGMSWLPVVGGAVADPLSLL